MAVNWIEELNASDRTIYSSAEQRFLKELLCYLQEFPISPSFQESLDERDFRTRGSMETKVNAGLRNYIDLKDDVKWVEMFIPKGVEMSPEEINEMIDAVQRKKWVGDGMAQQKLNKRIWWSEDYYNGRMKNFHPDSKAEQKKLDLLLKINMSIGMDDEMPSGFYLIEIYDDSPRPSIPKKIMFMYYDNTAQERVFFFLQVEDDGDGFGFQPNYADGGKAFNFATYRNPAPPYLWTVTYWGKGCKDIGLGIFNWRW